MAFDLPTSMIVLQTEVNQVVCVNLKNIKFINAEESKDQIKQLDFKSLFLNGMKPYKCNKVLRG